eukprot:m.1343793 g.1343793  ORF g.1343793 m.1343793 type:complete len:170 (-) comp24901_c1_seq50:2463-2972(-)
MESYLWLSGSGVDTDVHAAFRFTFSTENPNEKLSIHHRGISWYNVYVDGNYVAEGPTRFIGNTPYYDETEITIPTAGKHVVAVHAHSCGEQTRILLKTPPLVWVGIYNAAKELVKIRRQHVGVARCRCCCIDIAATCAPVPNRERDGHGHAVGDIRVRQRRPARPPHPA